MNRAETGRIHGQEDPCSFHVLLCFFFLDFFVFLLFLSLFQFTGEGGSIPFMGMLGEMFPSTQFIITGVLGPSSNAHGPNEFLHIESVNDRRDGIATVGHGPIATRRYLLLTVCAAPRIAHPAVLPFAHSLSRVCLFVLVFLLRIHHSVRRFAATHSDWLAPLRPS